MLPRLSHTISRTLPADAEFATDAVYFNEVESPLSHFILAHEALGHTESCRELRLRDALPNAQVTQQFTERVVFERKNGFGHLPILQPKVEYSKMGNSRLGHRRSRPLRHTRPSVAFGGNAGERATVSETVCWQAHRLRFPNGTVFTTRRVSAGAFSSRRSSSNSAQPSPPAAWSSTSAIPRTSSSIWSRQAWQRLGVTLDSAAKIPDVIVHYKAKNWLLLIEAVTSAGPVDGKRDGLQCDCFGLDCMTRCLRCRRGGLWTRRIRGSSSPLAACTHHRDEKWRNQEGMN